MEKLRRSSRDDAQEIFLEGKLPAAAHMPATGNGCSLTNRHIRQTECPYIHMCVRVCVFRYIYISVYLFIQTLIREIWIRNRPEASRYPGLLLQTIGFSKRLP